MRKRPNRIIEALSGLLPVSRRMYKKDLENILTVIQGIRQAEIQHSQVESNVLKALSSIQKSKTQSVKDEDDPAFG